MRKTIFECDGCGRELESKTDDALPNGWVSIKFVRHISGLRDPSDFERHVCNKCDDRIDPKNWPKPVEAAPPIGKGRAA